MSINQYLFSRDTFSGTHANLFKKLISPTVTIINQNIILVNKTG